VQAELLEQRDRIEDHVENLYEKLGVASRQELVARVFLDEYLPRSCSRRRSHRAGASTADSGPGAAVRISDRHDLIGAGMRSMTDDADATPATPDPDDHVARLQAQIDAAKARRAGYRAEAAATVARGGPVRQTDEELGIIKTDDTAGRIAADASEEIRSRLSRLMSRFGPGGKK
jgi:hypothetical protein